MVESQRAECVKEEKKTKSGFNKKKDDETVWSEIDNKNWERQVEWVLDNREWIG